MVCVRSLGMDIQIHPGGITERLEEMQKHLGRHISYFLPIENCIPYQPRPAAKIIALIA